VTGALYNNHWLVSGGCLVGGRLRMQHQARKMRDSSCLQHGLCCKMAAGMLQLAVLQNTGRVTTRCKQSNPYASNSRLSRVKMVHNHCSSCTT
jgi:hypothetical protein